MQPIIVTTTCSTLEEAESIGTKVLENRFAACIQISSAQSMYWWNGSIEREKEYVVTMKSDKSLFSQLATLIKKHHSYDVPEIIAEDLVAVEQSYRQWMIDELAAII